MTLADITPYLPYLSALVAGVPMTFIVFQGRSFFPLHYQLWRLAHRKADVSPAWLDGPVRERVELMKCRALLVWADSYSQARRIGAWAADHGVDLGTLGECGTYFDRDKLAMADKVPSFSKFLLAAAFFSYAACLFVVFGIALAVKDEALFSLDGASQSLFMTVDSARHIGSHRYMAMTLKDCATAADPAKLGVDRMDACDLLKDPHFAGAVAEKLQSQFVGGLTLAAAGIILLVALYLWGRTVRAANAVISDIHHHGAVPATRKTPMDEPANDPLRELDQAS